ncbi:MAG TPA: conjugal transfer protein TraF [Cellvibrio sp.]|nr:conjugal transfer protein TraF [Cellvibrio sp.]
MPVFSIRHHYLKPLAVLVAVASSPAFAISYGVYDSRALAMGGSATAIGTPAQAAFYNPALLAFNETEEEEGRDGRVYLPNIVVQVTDGVDSAIDAVDEELDTQLSNAVNQFNSAPVQASAGLIRDVATDLRDVLDDIASNDLAIDSFIGFNISEPSNREGGGFYFGARAIAGGVANVSNADRDLLGDYIDSMGQIAAGADLLTVAAEYPHLINSEGQLIDPTATLTSSADVSALIISEWGMTVAKQFELFDQAIAIGITPKLMRVDAFRDTADFNDDLDSVDGAEDEFKDTQETHLTLNADFGIAATIAEHYRVSLTLKDAFKKTFTTKQEPDPVTGEPAPDLKVTLSSRARMGVGYVGDKFSIGLDYDLDESTPMATEAGTQELGIGAEYVFWDSLAVRAGYRNDQTGLHENMASAGVGYRWRRFVVDIAYATGGDYQAGGLQMGWTF